MIRALLIAVALMPGLAPTFALGQGQAPDGETLADIRQEIQVLYVEVQRLRRELSTTGAPQANLAGTGALDRIDAMEAELRRLTGLTEELENRINSVVSDGTNRIGDLRFRLCELEAECDIASLEETPPLGGVETPDAAPPQPAASATELAVSEEQDFDRARQAFEAGEFRTAADLFGRFTDTYTGGPMTGEAHFLRGQALSELGDDAAAARAYLEAFSGQPQGPRAADALLQLGLKLDALDQRTDACATLGEVSARFPQSSAASEAASARSAIGCS